MANNEDQINVLKNKVLDLESGFKELQLKNIREKHHIKIKEPSTIIALGALLFSIFTTFVSLNLTMQQGYQKEKSELITVLQNIESSHTEYIDSEKKYQKDPNYDLIMADIYQKDASLVQHAVELVNGLPNDMVTANECNVIALALQNSYDNNGATNFFNRAEKCSVYMNIDKITALKNHGNLLFLMGDPLAGRQKYQMATNILTNNAEITTHIKCKIQIETLLQWARSEAGISLKNKNIDQLILAAENILPKPNGISFAYDFNTYMQYQSLANEIIEVRMILGRPANENSISMQFISNFGKWLSINGDIN